MLIPVPEEIIEKFHFSEDGGYLEKPYTEEEKRICEEYVAQMKKTDEEIISFEE